ncbi:hypothetical protein COT63_01080 [Candidatus Shapirobacteria bacterium CG09_land_8_20_14_0_10_38_17]|uniref:Uncharacterized protein n=1 Tax=Candidatus Shapirobacteria bacterium CG09_land_8_20_14_0_10_38_17 TaxID=1974884 RepID=A0A2H0WRG3_9BACT|nr:MAG: hypothetical protein COT63_01080 [Candidatus Shapirobacteria bacterium CG09_land_8_20_14_0_10_38_17]
MAKNLRFRDKILLTLSFLGDEFFEIIQPYSVKMKKMAGILPPDYKLTNFQANTNRMIRTGYMEKIVKDGEPYLRLSNMGKNVIARDFPFLKFRNKNWDGYWRVISYDIPEKFKGSRHSLQEKLKELGFGMLQKSIYISPHNIAEDLQEYIENNNLKDFAAVMVAKRVFGKSNQTLAWEVWNLEKLEEKYWEWISDGEEFQNKQEKNYQKFAKLQDRFIDIIFKDPFLPKELQPNSWPSNEAIKKFHSLLKQQCS